MFAEDIGLLPDDGFKTLLEKVKDTPRGFPVLVSGLWKEMATGTPVFCPPLQGNRPLQRRAL
jgi:hypothetical protein